MLLNLIKGDDNVALIFKPRKKEPSNVVQFTQHDKVIIVEKDEKKQVLEAVKNPDGMNMLINKAEDIQFYCDDHIIKDSGKYASIVNAESFVFKRAEDQRVKTFDISDYALSQLCAKIGVSSQYIKKCIFAEKRDLADKNINSWMQTTSKDLLLRTHKNKVRGVLSTRYSIFDTPDILEIVKEELNPEFKLKEFFMDEEKLHARFTLPEYLIEGETFIPGIQIDSSDVGRNTLSMKLFIFNEICTNGLVVSVGQGDLYTRKHIGITPIDFKNEVRESLKLYPQMIQEVKDLFIEKRSKKLNSIQISKIIHRVQEELHLSEETTKSIVQLVPNYGSNVLGLTSCLTEQAQLYTLDRRLEIERFAGNLLKVI